MSAAVDRAELKIGGALFGGWKSIRIERGMEQISGTFSLSVTERWAGQAERRPIKPGQACQVLIDGEPVITGYVDEVEVSYSKDSHSVTVNGRDKTGDLVDCSAIHKSGSWSGSTIKKIAEDLCKPFGIKVIVDTDIGAGIPSFKTDEATAFECLERAARMKAVLLMSDGLGNLVITRASKHISIPRWLRVKILFPPLQSSAGKIGTASTRLNLKLLIRTTTLIRKAMLRPMRTPLIQ